MSSTIRRRPTVGDKQPPATLSYGDEFGPYIITGFAGCGATSYVYKARRRDRFEPVAIKVLHPHLVADPTRRLTFYREARIMMRMQHPNVVRFEEILEEQGTLAFVMEYIDGVTLKEWRGGHEAQLDEVELACLFVDILRGVTAAHREGVVHRDLKPGNVLITEEGGRMVAKIIDFGVARFVDDPLTEREKTKITGTAAYISPEEVGNPELVCQASDLYSIGVMLYEAACGRRPFDGAEVRQLLKAHLQGEPDRPRELNPELSQGLEEVILRTLSKTPQSRFRSAPEMIGALEEALCRAQSPTEAMAPAAFDEEEAPTVQWQRPQKVGDVDEVAPRFGAFLKRCLRAALDVVTATGAEDGRDSCHHLNRRVDGNLPFY